MADTSTAPSTLRIHFLGLCTFVHDGSVVHALIPATGHGGGSSSQHVAMAAGHVEDHAVVLAHCRSGIIKDCQDDPTSPWTFYDLRGHELTIGCEGDGTTATPPDLFDICEITGGGVRPDLLTGHPGSNPVKKYIAARVTLRAGNVFDQHLVATYELRDGTTTHPPIDLPSELVWEIECETGGTTYVTLDGRPIPLPVAAGGVCELRIMHLPARELPPFGKPGPDLNPNTESPHFAAHYEVLVGAARRPRAFFKRKKAGATGTGPRTLSTGTCMHVRASKATAG